jgi:hypothetical protein
MAALTATDPTLHDLAQLPENKDAKDIINLLVQHNPMLEDAPAVECNKGTYHQTTVLTGLPTPTWGRLYKGVPTSKATRQSVKDTTGFLEGAGEVDTRLVDDVEKAEDKASIRMEEAVAQLEGMAQEAASALFYANIVTDPEKPMGFDQRFNSLSAENGGQIIDGGGTGSDNTSMWMVTWDKRACHLIYPKGNKAGLQRIDRGAINKTDANSDTYFVYREDFKWHMGLSVRDWRYVARGANIDVSDLTTDASAGADILNILTEMYYKHYGRRVAVGKTCLYMNVTLVKYLDYQARTVPTNLFLTFDKTGINADEVVHFRGIPIRESDAITSTESQIS